MAGYNLNGTEQFDVLNKSRLPHRHFVEKALKETGDRLRKAFNADEQILICKAHDTGDFYNVPNTATTFRLAEITADKITVIIEYYKKG